MSVSDKIEEAKDYFQSLTKSGRNNYQKYDYLETKDIFPTVRRVAKELGFKTKFHMDYEKCFMILIITDKEDGSQEEYHIRIPELAGGDAGKFMQDEGRIRTYAMRYLYIQAFEIAVPDEIDNRDQRKIPQKQPSKKVAPKNQEVKKEPVKEEPVPEEMVKDALDTIYDILTDAGKEFNAASAIFQIQRKYKDNPELIEACKKSLVTYTAEKIGGANNGE